MGHGEKGPGKAASIESRAGGDYSGVRVPQLARRYAASILRRCGSCGRLVAQVECQDRQSLPLRGGQHRECQSCVNAQRGRATNLLFAAATVLGAISASLVATPARAQFGRSQQVGGVWVDADGVLRNRHIDETDEVRAAREAMLQPGAGRRPRAGRTAKDFAPPAGSGRLPTT